MPVCLCYSGSTSEAKSDKPAESKFGRVILNKLEAKRSVINDERFISVSRTKNERIDLRKIKRTVYVRNEETEPEEIDVSIRHNLIFFDVIVRCSDKCSLPIFHVA